MKVFLCVEVPDYPDNLENRAYIRRCVEEDLKKRVSPKHDFKVTEWAMYQGEPLPWQPLEM